MLNETWGEPSYFNFIFNVLNYINKCWKCNQISVIPLYLWTKCCYFGNFQYVYSRFPIFCILLLLQLRNTVQLLKVRIWFLVVSVVFFSFFFWGWGGALFKAMSGAFKTIQSVIVWRSRKWDMIHLWSWLFIRLWLVLYFGFASLKSYRWWAGKSCEVSSMPVRLLGKVLVVKNS